MGPGDLDILESFGPLASLHAAFDAAGRGLPCATAGYFSGSTVDAVEAAISAVRARFTVLDKRLAVKNRRVVLEDTGLGVRNGRRGRPESLLSFTAANTDAPWTYFLDGTEGGTWLYAVWSHAIADGLSMMRFLAAVGARLEGDARSTQLVALRRPRTPVVIHSGRVRPDRFKPPSALSLLYAQQHAGGTWATLAQSSRDQFLADARRGGARPAATLAAAAALAITRRYSPGHARLLLNVPIARSDLDTFGGFGFGIGWQLLPISLDADATVATLARRIHSRLREMAREGWDVRYDAEIGLDPAQHRRMAEQLPPRPPPIISVSWKGDLGPLTARGTLERVGCFAATPDVHISSHADAEGLSLSVSSREGRPQREALLRDIVAALRLAPPPAAALWHID